MRDETFWTLDRLADALDARADRPLPRGQTSLRGISTDTRTVGPGQCFVALVGDRFDAHTFLEQAVAAGAAALVVSEAPHVGTLGVPVYVVDDTLLALADLASYWRHVWGRPVVAIAGSNGKTSTKELVRAALSGAYEVHATTGNLNNRIGVPLTLLAIPRSAEIAVVEIGTSLPGEVATLRDMVCPDIVVVTSVAEEHLEGLGDLDGVLREEMSACDGVALAIVPTAQPELAAEAARRAQRVVTAGLDDGDVHCDRWTSTPDGQGELVIGDDMVHPPVRGAHNLRNTMLALAVARELGVSVATAGRGIEMMPVPPMRTAWERVGDSTIVNDAYNSNPGSARAALDMLAAVTGTQRVVVLGTMLELGADAPRYHDDVARAAIATSADIIAGVGDFHDALRRIAPSDPRVISATDVGDLWPLLEPRLRRGATILLKASRGFRLERIIPHITTWATT